MKIFPASEETIQKAASALRDGQLVIIPTETVYGLAADASNVEAVRKIFEAKGRPSDNPLIVHITALAQLDDLTRDVPPSAQRLMDRFWPGPLTVVLSKQSAVPDEVTGGLDTVAIRMPAHPVAFDLIQATGRPLAAPSANRFMRLSPTRADNIDPALVDKVAMVLDGGPCRVGLESTVVDCTADIPRILRPGGVTRADIQAALGFPLGELPSQGPRRSPGMYLRHYAPRTPVRLTDALEEAQPGIVIGVASGEHQVGLPNDARAYGEALYASLYRLDGQGYEAIYVQRPPDRPEWEAVHDRLRKASAGD